MHLHQNLLMLANLISALVVFALVGLCVVSYSFSFPVSSYHTTEDFKRAAKAVSGVELKDHLVRVIFLLFDRDGMVWYAGLDFRYFPVCHEK